MMIMQKNMILKTYIATLKRKVNKNSNVSMGPKNLATPAHFISGLRPTPRRKICPRTNKEGPNCQGTLPRTILSLANQDHGRRNWHATKGSLPERPKGKDQCNETVMGVQWRGNSRISCYLRIKCPQLTSWFHLCGHDP